MLGKKTTDEDIVIISTYGDKRIMQPIIIRKTIHKNKKVEPVWELQMNICRAKNGNLFGALVGSLPSGIN